MKKTIFRAILAEAAVLAMALVVGAAGSRPVAGNVNYQEPDNSGANKQGGATADQQSQTPADRELARKIRNAITSDKSLSMTAHNVKVIVRDGMVTLKGPVNTEEEKQAIEAKAVEIAGSGMVKNQLTVKS